MSLTAFEAFVVVVSEAGLACKHFRDKLQEAIWLKKQVSAKVLSKTIKL